MSGIAKSVKKVFKSVGKGIKKVASSVAKVARKVAKSKVFKVALMGAAIYFGGAGLMSLSSGGTFMAGVSSAGTSLASAGSSLRSGHFAAGGSNLSAGIQGTTVAAQTAGAGLTAGAGTFAANPLSVNLAQGTVSGLGPAAQSTVSMAANPLSVNLAQGSVSGLMSQAPAAAATAASSVAPAAAGMSVGKGLMYSAGINAGAQAAGGYFNARAQEEQADSERERRGFNISDKRGGDYRFDVQSAFRPQTPRTVNDFTGG